ncbi:MAG: hypothetical protein HEP71_01230 [Roseivirga sp.]|nr:hypothetical protein [Roseivirga sp.]
MKNKFSLKTVVLEVFIVIVGISIAFWLNNWGEEKKERRLEVEFLKTLRSDLAIDSAAFVYQIQQNERNIKHLRAFVKILRNEDYINDSVSWYVGAFLNRNNWIINSNTYEILKSGGKLDIISDFELRSDISVFYRIRAFQADRILDVIQNFADDQMDPYLTKNTDYFISRSPDSSFIRDLEFQNLLALWTEFSDQKLRLYEGILADITQLIFKLDAHLK